MMSSTMTGEQCENETKSWCVVWFTESKEYSVIPTNWIVKNNESQSDSLFCKWPPYKVTSDHLKKAITLSQSWGTYRVKFVGVNKTYDNFNKAWHKKVKEKYSSTDTNDDSSKNKKKRLLMCPSDDTDDDDDDDNGINFNILPCKQVVSTPSVALEPIDYGASTSSMISQFYAENNVNVEETKQYTEMQPKTVQQLEYPQNHSFAEDTSCLIPVSHDSSLNFNGKYNK